MKKLVAAAKGRPIAVTIGLAFISAGVFAGLGLALGLVAVGVSFLFLDWVSE